VNPVDLPTESDRHAGTSPGAAETARMRVLTFTSLFPSDARPRHGIFVETRLAHLVHDCAVDARVVAPVPWFPFTAPAFGRYGRLAATPRRAVRANGIHVTYPRYLMLPRAGVAWQPRGMALAAGPDIARWQREGWCPELIDAHYLYPDGVAAALVAERLHLPFVLTARGTDVNVLARLPGPRRRIRWAADRAAAVIAVSARLRDALVDIGVPPSRVVVLRNGVDPSIFYPEDAAAARRRLQLPEGPLAVCVGNLVPEKGFELAIEMLRHVGGLRLVIVGDGPLRGELATLANRIGVAERLAFLPVMRQAQLRSVYSAADVLMLTSTREGWPNVVLESLACGTPVAALDVGAVGDMLTDPAIGRIVPVRDAPELAKAVRDLLERGTDRSEQRRRACEHASGFDWRSISRAQHELMTRALAAAQGRGREMSDGVVLADDSGR
jgi:glycosyltransferase involved in cell wall biosynthesis